MLPSVPSANDPNIVSLPLLRDHTTNSKQDQDFILPYALFNFPLSPFSPFSPYREEDSALYLQPLTGHSLPNTNTNMIEPSKQFFDVNGSISNKSKHNQSQIIIKEMVPRKRSTKKDRHSKINTIHGLRDRRMRLSLEVARKFFDLQDMLGFDKASKTVDWLLTQSNSAIEELSKNFKSSYNLTSERAWESSPSECDMISGVIDESVDAFHDRDQMEKAKDDPVGFPLPTDSDSGKARETSRSQCSTPRIPSAQLARESREKARARAKERTREKMSLQKLKVTSGPNPFEIVEEPVTSQSGHNNMKLPSMEVRAEVNEQKQFGAIGEQRTEDPFTITGNYLQSVGTFQDSQLRDFQLFLRPWEAYGGTSYLC